jgi:arsenate reductase
VTASPARRVRYLDDPPSAAEIARVLALLGAADPRVLMRTSEPRYEGLGLAGATAGEPIDAMASHPELIERPVVIWADRAVIARPPELLLPLLGTLGFQDAANLDDGDMWPVSYALKKWSPMVEKKVAELVKAAIS